MPQSKTKQGRPSMLEKPRLTAVARSKGRSKAATLQMVSREEREWKAELKAALDNAIAVLEQQIRILRAIETRRGN
jgi:hypothetical protein